MGIFLLLLVICRCLKVYCSLYSDIDVYGNSGVNMNQLEKESTTKGVPSAMDPHEVPPYFEDPVGFTNLTTQLGASVLLQCRINHLSPKNKVSWLRRRGNQLTLVTFGREVYIADGRYELSLNIPSDLSNKGPAEWGLRICNIQQDDEGHYECQLSTHPPLVYTVFLHVIVPELEIADERGKPINNKFYQAESTIELKCSIAKVPHPSQFIVWKHNTRILNYDTTRGGISVKTDLLPDGAKSRLYIANAKTADSGNYSCSLANVAETSVFVHVLNGETPAAMQHGACSSNYGISTITRSLILVWCLLTYR